MHFDNVKSGKNQNNANLALFVMYKVVKTNVKLVFKFLFRNIGGKWGRGERGMESIITC